jgi:hypothetical protein
MSNGDGSPETILEKAAVAFKKHPPINAMIVAWYSQNEKGSGTLRYLLTDAGGGHMTALLSDMAFENHIARRGIFGKETVASIDEVYPAKVK